VAHEQGWNLLHYHPSVDLEWLGRAWAPDAAVLGPEVRGPWPAALASCVAVSVNADRSADGVASVCLDEEAIAALAVEHMLAMGLRQLTTFRFDESPFAVVRERAFSRMAATAGARVVPGWWIAADDPTREDPEAMASWLRRLPRPCGIFTCCDAWARVVARYARTADLRVPEDVAIVGVDNDPTECELTSPPLSSVAVPWQILGHQAADLARLGLAGETIAGRRLVHAPLHVMARRSSDAMAIEDALVARAVRWIRQHSNRALSVPAVARAAATSRRRLERRFHAVLGRTVVQEIRRVRVEAAKGFLSTTDHDLARVAELSGFSSAALLNVAFQREIGLPPGAYRRRVRRTRAEDG
jgi:LacI family transcriptional regulator